MRLLVPIPARRRIIMETVKSSLIEYYQHQILTLLLQQEAIDEEITNLYKKLVRCQRVTKD